jgi:hypothetical protein
MSPALSSPWPREPTGLNLGRNAMNFNASESKSTTNDVSELTETEMQAIAAGFGSFGGLALQRAAEIYTEQQRQALYNDRI